MNTRCSREYFPVFCHMISLWPWVQTHNMHTLLFACHGHLSCLKNFGSDSRYLLCVMNYGTVLVYSEFSVLIQT